MFTIIPSERKLEIFDRLLTAESDWEELNARVDQSLYVRTYPFPFRIMDREINTLEGMLEHFHINPEDHGQIYPLTTS